MGMDKENRVFSFDSIGWTDPKDATPGKTLKWFHSLNFEKDVYPNNLINEEKPPSCVFVPDQKLMHTMIEATANSETLEELLFKFCDKDPPTVTERVTNQLFRKMTIKEDDEDD